MTDMSEEGGLVQELKELMQLNFTRVSMVHNPRECNQVAHALAILGKECEVGTNPILNDIPTCIMNIVADDISI
jgi:hypothetical protein